MNEISVLTRVNNSSFPLRSSTGQRADSSGFLKAMNDAVENLNGVQAEAGSQVSAVLSGNGQDIHSAMIAVERADLAFQLVMQVRNKVINAYQEVSHLQF